MRSRNAVDHDESAIEGYADREYDLQDEYAQLPVGPRVECEIRQRVQNRDDEPGRQSLAVDGECVGGPQCVRRGFERVDEPAEQRFFGAGLAAEMRVWRLDAAEQDRLLTGGAYRYGRGVAWGESIPAVVSRGCRDSRQPL